MTTIALYALLMAVEVPEWIGRPLAMHFELMDPREQRLAYRPEAVRERAWRLASAPRICRAEALPTREQVNQWQMFQRAHLTWLDDMVLCWPEHREFYKQWRREALELWEFWRLVDDVRSDYLYVYFRREQLAKIRNAMNPDDWVFGRWPPTYPWWRFRCE